MDSKILRILLSFGSNFGKLRAIWSNRVWCCILVYTFKKFESISSVGSRNIAKSLKISFGFIFVSLRSIGSKFWECNYFYPFWSFSVQKLLGRTDRQTDGRRDIFRKSFLFFSWSRIYIHVYTYLDYFSNFTPYYIFLTKVRIPFFPYWK